MGDSGGWIAKLLACYAGRAIVVVAGKLLLNIARYIKELKAYPYGCLS
ncbi:hypothetical protein ACLB1O_03075 [Escherichia coli]